MRARPIAVRLIQSAPSVELPKDYLAGEMPPQGSRLRVFVIHFPPETSPFEIDGLMENLRTVVKAAPGSIGLLLPDGVTFELYEETALLSRVIRETR